MPKKKISVTVDSDYLDAANQLLRDGGAENLSSYIDLLIAQDLARKGKLKKGSKPVPVDGADLAARVAKLEAALAALQQQVGAPRPGSSS
ncbi:hypothetical protein DB346_15545 [Verrucomicrobia bacterium LW23]|nr:hypothetical protein DB346_15545 [Verrucomicrobia bacterium LW23]